MQSIFDTPFHQERDMTADLSLEGLRVLMFVGDDYEDLELWYPKLRLIEAGVEVTLAGPKANHHYRGKHTYPCISDVAIADVDANDFHGVICPGGFMPDRLRRDPLVLRLVRHFAESEKLVAAICHGGWIPISAQVYRGVKVTGSPGIKDDLVNAGALWEDLPVVVDRHFVSSRKPDDLPMFCRGMLHVLANTASKMVTNGARSTSAAESKKPDAKRLAKAGRRR